MAIPSGTVTFVFTDVEGSTALLKELAERYGDVLGLHRRIVRETFGAAGGVEIDTQGDAFFFAFARAREAVAAAADVQRAHAEAEWPGGVVVRVRIGMHTGEPAVGEEGYLGLDVVRAARICAVARGGSVLMSEATRALIGSTLPQGASVFPRGQRHLKDIDEPERVYELEIEGVVPSTPSKPAEEATPSGTTTFEDRMESFGERLGRRIQDRVFAMVEKSLDKRLGPAEPGSADAPEQADEADLDDLAARAKAFEARIRARVEAAVEAAGDSAQEPEP